MKNIFTISFIIIGTIIGAGFASGKEIYLFFNIFGSNGLIGIVISNAIITFIIYKAFKIIKENNIKNYDDFLKKTIGKCKYLNNISKYIINIFLIISFFVMNAGFSSYLKQEYHLPIIIGASIIAVTTFVILKKGINGVKKINGCIIPILIVLVCVLGITKINTQAINCINYSGNWFIKSVLYSSYNTIMVFPLLATLGNYISTKKEIKKIALCIGGILLTISIIIFLLLNSYFYSISNLEIPMGYIAGEYKYIFGVLIIGAILTSVISIEYSFLENLKLSKKNYNMISIILSVLSIFFSYASFGTLVELLYPILGILGCLQIFFLFKP